MPTRGLTRIKCLKCVLPLGCVVFAAAAHAAAPVAARADVTLSPDGLTYDLRTVPFSRAGSYLAFSRVRPDQEHPAGIYLRTVRGAPAQPSIFLLETVVKGKVVPFQEVTSAASLRLTTAAGAVELAFAEPNIVRVHGQGVGLRLRMVQMIPVNSAYRGGGDRWVVNNSPNGEKFMLSPLHGPLVVDAPWDGFKSTRMTLDFLPAADGVMDGAIEEYRSVWHERRYEGTFDAAVASAARDFASFVAKLPSVASDYARAGTFAAYLLWSNLVAPQGYFKRQAMYMSKNYMNGVWSWDHGFNAMSLAYANPALAWDQLMMMFDLQDADGGLPDRVTDRTMTWAHNKPPVHGWMLGWMMKRSRFFLDPKRLAEIYGPLSRWTEWWFKFRDDDGDGLPQYQHGNDCGWDNSTPFMAGIPLESPDLPAYLVLQMDVLADVARRLGKAAEAKRWHTRADELTAKLLRAFWRGDHFVAYPSGDAASQPALGDSLLLFVPLLLGDRLPLDVKAKLVAGLKTEGRFLTAHGLATESLKSPFYQSDGYWRGPIWAPSTMLMVEALRAAGEAPLARDLSKRFCDMAKTTQMPENFDAQTGKDLRDPGYTWTSAVFLVLAHEGSM